MARISFSFPVPNTEFSVESGDFSGLEIRDSGNSSGFHYFFDTEANRLVTDFVIEDRPQVSTLISVTLIKREGEYSPRIKLWKKDKTKSGKAAAEYELADNEATRQIKAIVDTGSAYRNFWKVINYLQSLSTLALPDNRFRVVADETADLVESFEGKEKHTILEAVKTALGGSLTEHDIQLISNRKAQLQRFEKLLRDKEFFESEKVRLEKKDEALWQDFFEANPWIFGYGLHLIACAPLDGEKLERITYGANIFTGAGKRVDAILRTKGYVSSLAFCEIKTHEKPLLEKAPYRQPDVYQVSKEVTGGLSQVQKTVSKALSLISMHLHKLYADDGTPTGIQVSTIKPRQVLVIGNLEEFKEHGDVNPEKMASFELYRNSISDVEIITFDELYERACFIVRDM